MLDGNGSYIDELNQKTASISLCTDDKILYVTTATINNSTVEFKIDKAIPVGVYYVEIKVDNYIFPSDRSTIISIEQGATVYDLKDLIPNYDVSMTLTDILNKLNVKDGQVVDLQNKMNAIYSNALSDHAEILNARGGQSSLDSRLDGLDAKDTDLQNQINTNKTSITNTGSRIDNLIANAGNGTVPSELTDIRIGFDGKTYVSAGDAVRKQLLGINEKLTKTTNPDGNKLVSSKYGANNLINKNDLIAGYYINASGIMTQSADWYATDYIDVSNNVYINPQQGVGLSSWYDSGKNFISSFTPSGSVSVPSGAKYIRSSILNTFINTAYIVDGQRNVEGANADLNGYPLITKKPYRDGFQKFTVKVNKSKSVNTTSNDDNYEGATFEDVECHLYIPSNFYSPFGKPSKLLMLCHGAGKGAIDWQTVPSYVAMVKAFSANGYFVFDCNGFSNDALGCSFWGDQRGLTAWRKAYQYVTDNYNVEKEFSIYGFSMGGLTALNLAFQGLPNVKSIALGSPVVNLEAVFSSTDGTQNIIKVLYGMGDFWDAKKAQGSNPYANLLNIGGTETIVKSLPPIKIWYGSTETNNTGNPAVEKNYAKRFVDAINNGGGTAEYREVASGVHSLSYGANPNVTNEIITYLNRFSWGGE
ncbi:alpha/beta hydrolase family protein [Streptococcus uberis]|uniref:alpha/beta hydrolase family protein n=1 Tax=Streptococcus uberis TaxID=1349 RepID=UPI003891C4CD